MVPSQGHVTRKPCQPNHWRQTSLEPLSRVKCKANKTEDVAPCPSGAPTWLILEQKEQSCSLDSSGALRSNPEDQELSSGDSPPERQPPAL